MSASELLRANVIRDIHRIGTVTACWPTWQQGIRQRAGATPNASTVLALGAQLTSIFQTTAQSGRAQSDVSGGGAGWESLVCWYMNLCLIGTRTVVIKKRSAVPASVRDALTVTYGNVSTNSESDLVAVTLPDSPQLNGLNGTLDASNRNAIESYVAGHMGDTEALVIQCKTNWNDNAQIPMMWDMIYSAQSFNKSTISLGLRGHSIHTLKKFAYAFITLPSNRNAVYTPNSMPVNRVKNLSGGNYWGKPSVNGVASDASQIFARNFTTATNSLGQPWLNHLNAELLRLQTDYAYFLY